MFNNILNLGIIHPHRTFLTLFLFCSLIFTAHYLVVGNGIWGDGRYYFVITRSLVIDHDLDFSNERLVDPFYFDNFPTPIGRVGNKYAIGTALLWLPGFTIAHLISLLGSLFSIPLPTDGYSHLYRYLVGINSLVYGCLGLYFSYSATKKFFSPSSSLLATLTIGLGSHLFYYLALDPANSHPPSIFISSLIVTLWTRLQQRPSLSTFVFTGFLTGFLTMIRNHDLIFILPPLLLILKSSHFKTILSKGLAFFLSVFVGFSPQLLTWIRLYGTLTSPYFLLGEKFDLTQLHPIAILFSPQNGLFLFAPILLLSLFGLVNASKFHNWLAHSGLILWGLQTLFLSSWSGWWGGESFGGRMFLSLTPFFILGLAQIYHYPALKKALPIAMLSFFLTSALSLHLLLTH